MHSLLSRLWADDKGAIVSMELVLIGTLLVFGLIPGMVALRNATNAALATQGTELLSAQTGFSFSGYSILVGTTTIAQVNGNSFTPGAFNTISSVENSNIPSLNQGIVQP
jgi:hypothetical protein